MTIFLPKAMKSAADALEAENYGNMTIAEFTMPRPPGMSGTLGLPDVESPEKYGLSDKSYRNQTVQQPGRFQLDEYQADPTPITDLMPKVEQAPDTPPRVIYDPEERARENAAANKPTTPTTPANQQQRPPGSAPTGAPPSGQVNQSSAPTGGQPAAFVARLRAAAQAEQERTGIPASLTLAVGGLESGWGTSDLYKNRNNVYGWKGREPGTWSTFDSPEEATRYFADLIAKEPMYAEVYAARNDPQEMARRLALSGYVGYDDDDPEAYVGKIQAVERQVSGILTQPAESALSQRQPANSDQTFERGALTPNQYRQGMAEGLTETEAWAVCGPAAAVAFARANGRNPNLREAVDIAKTVGWNEDRGMAGPGSQAQLLQKMGIPARLIDGPPDWQTVAADVQRGNPVIISTTGHYFVAERYDPSTGKFDFGESARVLRLANGNSWFTPAEVANLNMGAPGAALYMDNPATPNPSVVAGGR